MPKSVLTILVLVLVTGSRLGSAVGASTNTWKLVDAGGNAPRDGLYLVTSSVRRTRFVTRADGAFGPAWSPDGTKIVFAQAGEDKGMVAVVSASGGPPRILVTQSDPMIDRPTWSPDGSKIAFLGVDDTLSVVDADGTNRRLVSQSGVDDFGWSPDGTKVVLATYGRIFSVDLIHRTRRLLASGPVGEPSWSPDGRSIAYFRRCVALNGGGDDIACDLAVMNADGSGTRTLIGGRRAAPYVPVVWSKDSRAVYLNVSPKEQGRHVLTKVSVSRGWSRPIGPPVSNLVLSRDGRSLGFLADGSVIITTLTGHVLFRSALPANALVDDTDLYVD